MLPEYKANRTYHDKDNFGVQRKEIIRIVKELFPFVTIRHPLAEADDVIAHLTLQSIPADHEKIIVSSDTDFIQLCQDAPLTQLYNPISKSFRYAPDYPYAIWKAFRGDSSDNIAGIRGIGNKRAAVLAADEEARKVFFEKRSDTKEVFKRNVELISLRAFSDVSPLQISWGNKELSAVLHAFTTLGFKSMISQKAWQKYSAPFEELNDGTQYIINSNFK